MVLGEERRTVAKSDGIRIHGVRIELHVADRHYAVRGPHQGSVQRGEVPHRAAL